MIKFINFHKIRYLEIANFLIGSARTGVFIHKKNSEKTPSECASDLYRMHVCQGKSTCKTIEFPTNNQTNGAQAAWDAEGWCAPSHHLLQIGKSIDFRKLWPYLKAPLGYTFLQIFGNRFQDEIILHLFSGVHTGESEKI